jgi:hypothetical protein
MKIYYQFILAFAVINLSTSCSKTDSTAADTVNNEEVAPSVNSRSLYQDSYNVMADIAASNGLMGKNDNTASSCATITKSPNDSITFPKSVTIDFGVGCTSASGLNRSGIINVSLTNKLHTTGSVATLTYTNFIVNGYALGGTYTITCLGSNKYSAVVVNGTITKPDGSKTSFNSTDTLIQTTGISTTANFADDTYSLTGKSTGNTASNIAFTEVVISPVIIAASCKYLTQGTTRINLNGKSLAYIIDFGAGACDSIYTVTYGRATKSLAFPY